MPYSDISHTMLFLRHFSVHSKSYTELRRLSGFQEGPSDVGVQC